MRNRVTVRLLGGFGVTVDTVAVPDTAWTRRQPITLVKLLALAPGRQLHREQVIAALWPNATVEEAAPRLHKAAHYARRVLGPDGVVLHRELVSLFPNAGTEVHIDAVDFDDLASEALKNEDVTAAGRAVDAYSGDLLPEDRYEEWAQGHRERLRRTYLEVCRLAGRWSDLVAADPTDVRVGVALMRERAASGDHHTALRLFERLDRARQLELGAAPDAEALALRDALIGPTSQGAASQFLVGRRRERVALERVIEEAATGRGRAVLIAGAAGMGKSTLAAWLRERVVARGWRTGQGVVSAVEGAWPFAPVLEALADLARRHPTLLDGLNDRYRDDIDRALSGDVGNWAGQSAPQRLFIAVAQLARLAAAGPGLLLTVEDVHDADEGTLRLLRYLVRSCRDERLVLLLTHRRQPTTDAFERIRNSLLGRSGALDLALPSLTQSETAALVAAQAPDLPDDVVEHVWSISGGVPFMVTELARSAVDGELRAPAEAVLGSLAPPTRAALERVALMGSTFDTDGFIAMSDLPEEQAFDCLDAALAVLVIERTLGGFRFRHPLIREALLDAVPPHRRSALHRSCARRLIEFGASPARVGHHLLAAGDTAAAVPFVLRAAQTEVAVGAFRDALSLVESILGAARDEDRVAALTLRADALAAIGDPAALSAYREALAVADQRQARVLRARMGQLAVLSGDTDTAAAVLHGLEPDGGPDDSAVLLAHGALAYFTGDIDGARAAVSDSLRADPAQGSALLQSNLVALRGLITHTRGEWNHTLRAELMRTRDDPGLATTVFDAHLCVAEYLLYGPTPYEDVIDLAQGLRRTAQSSGVLRAVAFARALAGEAELLAGNLDEAERELSTAVDLHREIGATAGEAHSLQRLAEVHLTRGHLRTATRLLRRALPLARSSVLAPHLIQRIYGTTVAAADSPEAARAAIDAAKAAMAQTDSCDFCAIMFEVPATITCVRIGDLDAARTFLAAAERSSTLWEGTAWQAATLEARAHLLAAEGDAEQARQLRHRAAEMFDDVAHPLDAARCRAG
ncbi:ATP-binding protein [Micromonospora sp. NPDC049366]|uniref:ATP-binding protein n=1 Tax=Micromonospora sp. NPDC049366 TaxID=3364271 RepID=UPI00378F4825